MLPKRGEIWMWVRDNGEQGTLVLIGKKEKDCINYKILESKGENKEGETSYRGTAVWATWIEDGYIIKLEDYKYAKTLYS